MKKSNLIITIIALLSILSSKAIAQCDISYTVCVGSSITVSSGFYLSSGYESIFSVSGSTITGVAPGYFLIYYGNNCNSIEVVETPTISGTLTTTISGSTTLSASMPGGTWSSSNPSILTVNSSGVVTGVSYGSADITYVVPSGCSATVNVSVTCPSVVLSPSSISLCNGTSTSITASVSGGTWSSSNPDVASISSGTVYGLSVGSTTITYTAEGCNYTVPVNVNPTPTISFTGTTTICSGTTTSINASGASTYTWSPSFGISGTATSSATLNPTLSTTYSVTGTNSYGCSANGFLPITVQTVITPTISHTGYSLLYPGAVVTTTLVGTPSGGTWTSGNTSVATMSPTSGVINSVCVGTSLITYTYTNTCGTFRQYTTIGVQCMDRISGLGYVCGTQTYTHPTSGGVWSVSDPSVATINPSTGVLTSLSGGGLVTISYTASPSGLCTSCSTATVTKTVALLPYAGSIVGPDVISIRNASCGTNTVTYTNPLAVTYGIGGSCKTWSSSNPSVATISSSGVVTALSCGTTTLSYTYNPSCFGCGTISATKIITVGSASCMSCRGINETDDIATNNNTIRIYPNPTNRELTISYPSIDENTSILFSDISGRIILEKNIEKENQLLNIDISWLSSGVYYINLRNTHLNYIEKIIKK